MTDIKTIYKDSNGNEHATRAQAKKANRLIDASKEISGDINCVYEGECSLDSWTDLMIKGYSQNEVDLKPGLIEFARAVVAIYGMKDKAPKEEKA